MKIHITLKDPDRMHEAVTEAVDADVKSIAGLSVREREQLTVDRAEEIAGEISERWMAYGEYLDFEVDTETWTATILAKG